MKEALHNLEKFLERGGVKKDIALLAISALFLILSLINAPLPFNPAWVAIVLCGFPIILEAAIGILTSFDLTADFLVSLALIASVMIGEDFAAGEVAFIMQLGALLEELTVSKAEKGIEKLVKLTPEKARIIAEGEEKIIRSEEVKAGDIIKILPGEIIPCDGVVIEGITSVDEAVMTGEAIPADKEKGSAVTSGGINQYGAITVEATRDGSDSSIQRMVRLTESADASKARIVGIADRWAFWIVIIALSAALLVYLATKEAIRAVTVLVVFCPCSLVLATPTAIMAAIGNASKKGFLVKDGDALERLSSCDIVTFDKTGTLTKGKAKVHAAVGKDNLLEITASAESSSEHPLGKAIADACKNKLPSSNFEMIPGRGIRAEVEGKAVLSGSLAFLEENGIKAESDTTPYTSEGDAIIHTCFDGEYLGFIALSDTLRNESRDAVTGLKALGVRSVLLTGDHEKAALSIARKCGIENVISSCRPEDKLNAIKDMQKNGSHVAMVGDGINDAPSLKASDVGIAMGGIGSDIAMDASSIVLVSDRLDKLVFLFSLSRKMMRTIKRNITFSMALNFLAIALAMAGVLNPVSGALVHNAGSVVVIVSSALLLSWKK